MSSSSSSSTYTVSLYRYDLTHGMARSMGPMLIGRPLEGIWHTSIVAYGKEYFFDGGVGIMADVNPGRTRFGPPYRTEVLGETRKRQEEFFVWTQQQRTAGFGPDDYRLFDNNCNSFTDAATMFLLGRHIPQDIRDMIPMLLATPMGRMLQPMLEQATAGGTGIGGMTGQNSRQPLASPGFSSASPPSSPNSLGDSCAGLLRPRQEVTETEEEDLMLAQAMLESNETIADGPKSPAEAFDRAISGLTLLRTVMRNIREHPREAKYRALSMDSTAYKTKLKPLELYGVTELLSAAGFVRRPHPAATGGDQWYLADKVGSAALLQRVEETLTATMTSIEVAAAEAAAARNVQASNASSEGKRERAEEADDGSERHPSLQAPPPPPASSLTHPPAGVTENTEANSSLLRYCSPPFPASWVPLPVGKEHGTALFSIHCFPSSAAEGPYCFGKCRLAPNGRQQHVLAHFCSSDGREIEIYGGYEVLCVRREEPRIAESDGSSALSVNGRSGLSWVPASMVLKHRTDAAPLAFTGYGRFAVVRAEHGSGLQPGVMEPSGRCVIPYSGRALVVTEKAEVLCETARLPEELVKAVHALQRGRELLGLVRRSSGQPIGSFMELLNEWTEPAYYCTPPPVQSHTCRSAGTFDWVSEGAGTSFPGSPSAASPVSNSNLSGSAEDRNAAPSRLLVCHDFGGGYTRAEGRMFVLEVSPDSAQELSPHSPAKTAESYHHIHAVETAYEVHYWDRVDVFAYFTHQRISVPPREWIGAGHRRGVPVLGTVLTEGADGVADLEGLLGDAKRMASVIARLVELCDVYGFDGYLLNVENGLSAPLAKRLIVFCTHLRKQLNRRSSSASATPRQVVWYDAVTIEGGLVFQNALTARNKPFFDVCDGLFTNYFWNPMHMAMTRTAAGARASDVYVGVDVFGRRMYGGGGYNTVVAVEEATHLKLSVALFAPGWSMECESKGSRDGFWAADSRLWARMQEKFMCHTRVLCRRDFQEGGSPLDDASELDVGVRFWTTFQSGIGYDLFVNGQRQTNRGAMTLPASLTGCVVTSAWCELSAAHAVPPFLFEAPPLGASTSPRSSVSFAPAPSATAPSTRTGPLARAPFRLPSRPLHGAVYGGTARAEWRYDAAWFGDRCLGCAVPPMEAVELLRCFVRNAFPADVTATNASTSTVTEMPSLGSAPHCAPLILDVMIEYTPVSVTNGDAAMSPSARAAVAQQRGLRLGLVSKSRGSHVGTVWEKAVQASMGFAPVTGAAGLQVRVTATAPMNAHLVGNATNASECTGVQWMLVRYELINRGQEPVHLTSLSLANGDASRTLQCCVGGIGISDGAPRDVAGEETRDSVLWAEGPYDWSAFHSHATGNTGEHVLELSNAVQQLSRVRSAQKGSGQDSRTLVLFATVGRAVSAQSVASAISAATEASERAAPYELRAGERTMYLGQYSAAETKSSVYEDSILVPVSLPPGLVVTQLHFYSVKNGF